MSYTYNITFTVSDKNRVNTIKSETIGDDNIIGVLFKFQILVVQILQELNLITVNEVNDDIPF